MPKRLTLGLGPPSGVSIGRLSWVGALWDCVSRVCGGRGGCASGGVPLGAGPCCPDVGRCLSGVYIIIIEVAATAATTGRAAEWMVSRVPDTSRGRRIAQSDGLVRLTILSADGHPKGARGHELSRSQQLPTAVSPQKIIASFLRLVSQGI